MGLFGQEGLQAVQNSDFALANFRYLWKLILVEGRMNHLRVSKFIFMFMYKNISFTFIQFLFGFLCNWSAQTVFDEWYISNYNMVFTAFSVSYLGNCDQDIRYRDYVPNSKVEQKKRFKDPIFNEIGEILPEDEDMESVVPLVETQVYRTVKDIYQYFYYMTQKNLYFNMTQFYYVVFESLIHSTMITLIMLYSFEDCAVDIDGRVSDFWSFSLSSYSNLLIIVNIITLMRASHITMLFTFAIIFLSIAPFFLFVVVYDRMTSYNEYSTYSMRFNLQLGEFYLASLVCIFAVCFIEICKFFLKFYNRPSLVDFVLKLKKLGLVHEEKYFKKEVLQVVKENHLGYKRGLVDENKPNGRVRKLVDRVTMS